MEKIINNIWCFYKKIEETIESKRYSFYIQMLIILIYAVSIVLCIFIPEMLVWICFLVLGFYINKYYREKKKKFEEEIKVIYDLVKEECLANFSDYNIEITHSEWPKQIVIDVIFKKPLQVEESICEKILLNIKENCLKRNINILSTYIISLLEEDLFSNRIFLKCTYTLEEGSPGLYYLKQKYQEQKNSKILVYKKEE